MWYYFDSFSTNTQHIVFSTSAQIDDKGDAKR